MGKNSISGIPRYFEADTNDCFSNALASYISYENLNTNLLLSDYLSFMYDEEAGYIGLNYLYKPYSTVMFTEEELNTSLYFFYFHSTDKFKPIEQNGISIGNKNKISVFRFVDNTNNAYCRAKELIDNGKPIIVAVDMYYMSYHKAYKKEHGLHYIVITGYDEEKNIFELFDKYKLASCDFDGSLPISDINDARSSDNPQNSPLIGCYERPILNNWIEIKINNGFKVTQEDINNIIKESIDRMAGKKLILGQKCGLGMMEAFIKKIESKKLEDFDEKNVFLFRSYFNEVFKVLARSRKRFKRFIFEAKTIAAINSANEIEDFLEESARCWDISANLSYKLSMTKKLSIIDDIVNQLNKIVEKERIIIDILSN